MTEALIWFVFGAVLAALAVGVTELLVRWRAGVKAQREWERRKAEYRSKW